MTLVKRTLSLDKVVHILLIGAPVGFLVVGDVVNLVTVEELLVDLPRRVRGNLIDPFAVPDGLTPFSVCESRHGLVGRAEFVGADADNEVDGRKTELGLPHLEGVPGRAIHLG